MGRKNKKRTESQELEFTHRDPLDAVIHLNLKFPEWITQDSIQMLDEYGRNTPLGEWTRQPGSDTMTLTITPRNILQALKLDRQEKLNCAFCGKQYDGVAPIPRETLEQHIRVCDQHPITQELIRTRELLVRTASPEWDDQVSNDLRQLQIPHEER